MKLRYLLLIVFLMPIALAADVTPPTITFLTQTPSDIMWNSTGVFNVTFNITDAGGVNESSIVFFNSVNHSHDGITHYNWSYRYPESAKQPEGLRADNRNKSKWWESVIRQEYGIDDIWSWSGRGHAGSIHRYVNILDNDTNYAHVNVSMDEVHEIFVQSWYVDRSEMIREDKNGQYIDIYKNKPAKIAFNLSMHNLSENYTGYIHLNIEPQNSDKDLIFYVCNLSYTTGNPINNDNCQSGPHITGSDSRSLIIENSSYVEKAGGLINGYYGSVKATEQMYFILQTDESSAGEAYRLYYANNTIADNTDFDSTNVLWTSTNSGNAWNQYSGTPDIWYAWDSASYETIMYYVYACDDLGNCANSTIQTDTMESEANLPPTDPTITTPVYNENYTSPINITWTTPGDVDGDTYYASVLLYNNDGTINSTLCNHNISSTITWHNWITTGVDDGLWHINVTLCDNVSACSNSLSGNFTIDNNGPTFSGDAQNVTNSTAYVFGEVYQFNVTIADARDISLVYLELNSTNYTATTHTGSEWYDSNITDLPAAIYTIKWYANDSSNNWDSSTQYIYELAKASTCSTAFVDGHPYNKSFEVGSVVNFTGYIDSPGYDVTIYLDINDTSLGDNFHSGLDPTWNTTNTSYMSSFLGTNTTYNFTTHFDGDENYSADSHSLQFNVYDTTKPVYSQISPANGTDVSSSVSLNISAVLNDLGNISHAIMESNFTTNSNLVNYTMTGAGNGLWYYMMIYSELTNDEDIYWRIYFNDTNDQWNTTSIYYVTGKEAVSGSGGGPSGSTSVMCGDGVCEGSETWNTCPEDCYINLSTSKVGFDVKITYDTQRIIELDIFNNNSFEVNPVIRLVQNGIDPSINWMTLSNIYDDVLEDYVKILPNSTSTLKIYIKMNDPSASGSYKVILLVDEEFSNITIPITMRIHDVKEDTFQYITANIVGGIRDVSWDFAPKINGQIYAFTIGLWHILAVASVCGIVVVFYKFYTWGTTKSEEDY